VCVWGGRVGDGIAHGLGPVDIDATVLQLRPRQARILEAAQDFPVMEKAVANRLTVEAASP
jgi:hypothetical protein